MLSLLQIVLLLLSVLRWIIIIQIVLSWLFTFNVINHSNDFVRQLVRGLSAVTEPLYRPIRRVLPDFGGLDFAPLVVLLAIVCLEIVIKNNMYSLALAGTV